MTIKIISQGEWEPGTNSNGKHIDLCRFVAIFPGVVISKSFFNNGEYDDNYIVLMVFFATESGDQCEIETIISRKSVGDHEIEIGAQFAITCDCIVIDDNGEILYSLKGSSLQVSDFPLEAFGPTHPVQKVISEAATDAPKGLLA